MACPGMDRCGALPGAVSESSQSPTFPIPPHCFPPWGHMERPQGPWLPDSSLLPSQLGPLPLVLGHCWGGQGLVAPLPEVLNIKVTAQRRVTKTPPLKPT